MRARCFLLLALLLVPLAGRAQAVQQHGVIFEKWVRTTFFDGYQPTSHTQRWDIPASANLRHGGIPVNPKAIKYGTAIDLGDALRQYEIDEPFLLIVGFWQQTEDAKKFVSFVPVTIQPEQWRKLWGTITYSDLRRFDALIKDRGRPVAELRKLALQMKAAPPFTSAIIQMNPKIDTHGQRRLQCSLRFNDFFDHLAPSTDRKPQAEPSLFGVPYPGLIDSPARQRQP